MSRACGRRHRPQAFDPVLAIPRRRPAIAFGVQSRPRNACRRDAATVRSRASSCRLSRGWSAGQVAAGKVAVPEPIRGRRRGQGIELIHRVRCECSAFMMGLKRRDLCGAGNDCGAGELIADPEILSTVGWATTSATILTDGQAGAMSVKPFYSLRRPKPATTF